MTDVTPEETEEVKPMKSFREEIWFNPGEGKTTTEQITRYPDEAM